MLRCSSQREADAAACFGQIPVEIVQFCWEHIMNQIVKIPAYVVGALPMFATMQTTRDNRHSWDRLGGCRAQRREKADGQPYVTDNGNYIVDLYYEVLCV